MAGIPATLHTFICHFRKSRVKSEGAPLAATPRLKT
ncbi:mCG147878 [Mus musculus]|nr:mCG147878 [Mus musculus]